MILLFVSHIILAGLMGIHSKIVTVGEVSVKAGGSVSIPCLYESENIHKVKYLCKGKQWRSCSPVVTTNKTDKSGKFSISDDPKTTTFTVTINDPIDDGSSYWCAVDNLLWDDKRRFELSITKGMPSLYVDQQEITEFEGRSVTVACRCENPGETRWCRLNILSDPKCVPDQTGSIDGTTVAINADVFTVTMSGLKMESGGWYWCDNEDFQMPVHLTVLAVTSSTTTTTTATATTVSPNTASTPPTITQHSSLFTSAEPYTAQPTNSIVNGTGGGNLQQQHKSSTMVTILAPTLVLLLLLVSAAFFGWRMIIRHSKTKSGGSDITEGSKTRGDPDVHYATIVHNQHAAAQQKNDIPEDSVTYSTLVMKDIVRQTIEPVDGSVIYSTIKAN